MTRSSRGSSLKLLQAPSRILAFPADGPVQGSSTRMASSRRAQRRAGRGDGCLESHRSATSPHRSSAPSCSSAPDWRSGMAVGTAATTRSPTASSSRLLASLLGPQAVGLAAVIASSYFFDRLVRDRWGVAARWATLWFAAGVVTLLAEGQLTFALGVAFGLAVLRFLQVGRSKSALLASRALRPVEPGRGGVLRGSAARRILGARPRRLNRARALDRGAGPVF